MSELNNCSVCGRCLVSLAGVHCSGVSLRFEGDTASELFPEIEGKEFDICPVCWLKSLGVKI